MTHIVRKLIKTTMASGVLMIVAACQPMDPSSTPSSHMDPHVLPTSGPFFEGWYLRVTANDNQSFGGLVASYRSPDGQQDKSYAAVFAQTTETRSLAVNESISASLPRISSHDQSITDDPDPASPADFRWELPGVGSASENRLSIKTQNGTMLDVTLGDPVLWNDADIAAGPEGPWEDISALKGHWFVHSLASPAQWTLTTADGQQRAGTGLAHYEKNWGAAFPRYWVWAQGIDSESGTAFVLAGGENPLLPELGIDAWILGVKTPGGLWHFATGKPGQIVQASTDGCRGHFALNGVGIFSQASIEINAPRESFSGMLAPTANGFAERSEQSFRATATIRLMKKLGPVYGQPTVISIPNSALEFGGNWRCQPHR